MKIELEEEEILFLLDLMGKVYENGLQDVEGVKELIDKVSDQYVKGGLNESV